MSVIKNSSIYLVSNVARQSIPFLLLPIMTRILTPEEFGLVTIFMVLVNLSGVFIGLSGHGAVGRAYYDLDRDELASYTGTAFFILAITFVAAMILMFFFHPALTQFSNLPANWLFWIPLIGLANYITLTNLVLWQVEEQPVPYGCYQFLQTLCNVLLSILLVVWLDLRWQGRLWGIVCTTIVFALVSQWILQYRKYLSWKWNSAHARSILRFGVPLLPHQLSSWVITSLDRMIIVSILGLGTAGVYAVAATCAQAIALLAESFGKAWSPFVFKQLTHDNSNQNRRNLVAKSYLYIIILSCIGLCYLFIAPILMPLVAGKNFEHAIQFLPVLIVAEVIAGWYRVFAVYIFYEQKTELLSLISFLSGIIHIFLLWFFLKHLGVMGVAVAYAVSAFARVIMTAWLSNRVHPMPWFIFWTWLSTKK